MATTPRKLLSSLRLSSSPPVENTHYAAIGSHQEDLTFLDGGQYSALVPNTLHTGLSSLSLSLSLCAPKMAAAYLCCANVCPLEKVH